jgi:hypothetical protein
LKNLNHDIQWDTCKHVDVPSIWIGCINKTSTSLWYCLKPSELSPIYSEYHEKSKILYWLERKVFILSMKVSILSQIYTQNCQHRTWSSIGICLDILSNTQVSYFYIFVSVSVSSRSVWLLACIINLRRFLVKYLYLNKLNELNHCISGVYGCTEQWKVSFYGPDSLICKMSRLSRPHNTGSSVNFTWGY